MSALQTAEAQILQGLDAMQAECAAAIEQAHEQAQVAAEERLRAAYEMGKLDKERQVLIWIEQQLERGGRTRALEDLKKLLLNP